MSDLTPIEKAQLARKEKMEAGEFHQAAPRNPIERWRDKDTRKTAIDAMCYICMGGPEGSGMRTDIAECTSGPDSQAPCPLWSWRPYKGKGDVEEELAEDLL